MGLLWPCQAHSAGLSVDWLIVYRLVTLVTSAGVISTTFTAPASLRGVGRGVYTRAELGILGPSQNPTATWGAWHLSLGGILCGQTK